MNENDSRKKLGFPPQMRIVCVGAHPDDCEYCCGGMAAHWRDHGHSVTFLSVTNGESGHHEMAGPRLIARRREEARKAAAVIGAESRILDVPDGGLAPTLETRLLLIRVLRELSPHIVVTNRPNDYHPDHRYTAQLVQDAAYSLMVPNIAPEAPAMPHNPIILYWWDRFRLPVPFDPTIVVSIDSVFDRKIDMLHEHESQVYEWLPWVNGFAGSVPAGGAERKQWLRTAYASRQAHRIAEYFRDRLRERYGRQAGDRVIDAEAYELCEYGMQPNAEDLRALFTDTPDNSVDDN